MCYHTSTPTKENLKDLLGPEITINDYQSYHHASGFAHPELPLITAENTKAVSAYSWGLIPFFAKDWAAAKDIRIKTLNAKSETIFQLPSFKSSAKSKRCIIYVDGFFEWRHEGKDKIPHFIYLPGRPLALGGLYNSWTNKETGEVIDTCSIITTPANELMKHVHNSKERMPFVLQEKHFEMWLDKTADEEFVQAAMVPYTDGELKAHKISKLITSRTESSNVPEVKAEVVDTLF